MLDTRRDNGMDNQTRGPGPPTVFIVDDDAAVLNALGFALEMEGFRVRTFQSAAAAFGAKGIDLADCLVIDQNLADEFGIDLLDRLRARGSRAPAVMITTHPGRDLQLRAAALCVPVVEKPLLDDQLFACIRALAGRV